MRKPLFALMRGADGRSLTRALIALLLVNVLVSGFHAGAMAATDGAGVGFICTLAAGDPGTANPGAPRPTDDCPCCILGCLAGCGHSPMSAVVPALVGLALAPTDPAGRAIIVVRTVPPPRMITHNGPRSPPLAA